MAAEIARYETTEQTMLAERIKQLAPLLTNRALLLVLGDLNEPAAIAPLKRLGQRHDVVALQLQDPAERGIAPAGFLNVREAETGRSFTTRGGRLGIDHEWIKQELKRGRVDHLLLPTDQPVAHRLRHFFKSRGLLGRGAR
jgi:signal recognition particle GTPase